MLDSSMRRIIRVPGSIANLGSGFDTLAVAVQLYLELQVDVVPGTGELHFDFANQSLQGENCIERAFLHLAGKDGRTFPSMRVTVLSDIPMKAGLGSSAAATVAGLRLYEFVHGPLSDCELLNAACELEGHPDNVSAALLGGFTVSCETSPGNFCARTMPWPDQISFVVVTPDLALSTKSSRAVLPDSIARKDAIFNLQRVALFLHAMQNADFDLLREALRDRLHQPFRSSIVPGLEQALQLRHPDLLGVCLSGAGPSIAGLVRGSTRELAALLGGVFEQRGIPAQVRVLKAHASEPLPARVPPQANVCCVDSAVGW